VGTGFVCCTTKWICKFVAGKAICGIAIAVVIAGRTHSTITCTLLFTLTGATQALTKTRSTLGITVCIYTTTLWHTHIVIANIRRIIAPLFALIICRTGISTGV